MMMARCRPGGMSHGREHGTLVKKESDAAAPRVRSYFPEALYINPEIITDQNGRASIAIPLADSITTWRMAMLASTHARRARQRHIQPQGLPGFLRRSRSARHPHPGRPRLHPRGRLQLLAARAADVSLQLQPDDWFALVDDVADKTVAVESGRVGGSQFTLEAKRIGKFKLTLSARMTGGANRADIVVREIEVIPNGREQTMVFNGRLETAVRARREFPADRHPRRQQDLRPALPRPAEPGDRRHGQPSCACPAAASSRPPPAPIPTCWRSTT